MINYTVKRYARIRMDSVEEAEDFAKQLNTYISAQEDLLEDPFWAEMSVEVVGLSVVIGSTLAHIIVAMVAVSDVINNEIDN